MKKLTIWILVILMLVGILPQQLLASATGYTVVGSIGTPTIYSNGANGGLYLAQKTGFTVSTALADSALALHFRLYVARTDNASSIDGFMTANGQVELSSSGSYDKQAIIWKTNSKYLVAGWNDIILPFSDCTFVNGTGTGAGTINKASINWFRLYNYVVNSAVSYSFAVDTVEIINTSSSLCLPSIYDNGMLFERDKPINITGTGVAGHIVTAKMLNGSTQVGQSSATVAVDGSFKVSLPALSGGYTKYTIQVFDGTDLIRTLSDVVVGELWLAAGQSNMQFMMWQTPSAVAVLNNPNDEYLRYLDMPGNPVGLVNSGAVPYSPQTSIKGAYWGNGKSNSSMLYSLSAVAYYFAEKLRAELDMPVGILNVPMGATSIYAWLSRTAIDGNSTVKTHLETTSRYRTLANWNLAGEGNFTQMSAMYNQKVAPLINLNIKGMIWYQGETDSGDTVGSYTDALNLLLHDYSTRFGFSNDTMPLIYSHIAPLYYNSRPFESNAIFSEDMSKVWQAHSSNMAQIPIYDIPLDYKYTPLVTYKWGGDDSIHPYTKQPVGERMAAAALGMVYGKSTEYTAPVYKSLSVLGNALYLKFDHVGDGLSAATPTTSLKGFTVAGADGIYVPAKAEIIAADTVKVWNETVGNPKSATYAFTEMNMHANLYSTLGGQLLFPAVPFRTEKGVFAKYEHPKYWTSCDLSDVWHSSGLNQTAEFYSAWEKGMLSQQPMTFSYDTGVKTEGNSSLKIDYITDQNKAFDPAPKTLDSTGTAFLDTDNDFSRYGTLSFDIKNMSGRVLTLGEMLLKGSDGAWYRPYVLGTDSFSKTLSASTDWQTVTLDFTKFNKMGADLAQIFTASSLSSTSNIQFDFYDSTVSAGSSGTIYLDNFVFGFKADKVYLDKLSLYNAVELAKSINTDHYNNSLTRISEFTAKLNFAETTMSSSVATQAEINTATQNLKSDYIFNNTTGTGAKPQKISLGSFYNAAGSAVDVKTDADGNLVQELNSSWSGQGGQLIRTVGFGANLSQSPYLIIKVKSSNFQFQMLFRYTGSEYSDDKRTFLMVQDVSQVSATEKTYIFDLRKYFRTDIAAGTEVPTEYSVPVGAATTRNIAITNAFEECAINFVPITGAGNSKGDKIVISNLYLSPTAEISGLDELNTASSNKVPVGATRIANSTIAAFTPTAVFNADNTFQITAAAGTATPVIISLDGINIAEKPILYIDFKSSPTGSYIDFVGNPQTRMLNSAAHTLQNCVVAIDLRNIYFTGDNKVLYLYNWNGFGTASTMVLNGIYSAAETIDSSYYFIKNNNISGVEEGTTVTTFKNKLSGGSEASFGFKDLTNNIITDYNASKAGTGTMMDITVGGKTRHFTMIIYGDLNGTGTIDVSDLSLLKRHLLKVNVLTGVNFIAAGIASKNSVSVKDLLAVKKHILGIDKINQNKNIL